MDPGQDHPGQAAGSQDQGRVPAREEVAGASREVAREGEAGPEADQEVGPAGEVRAAPGASLGLAQPAGEPPGVRAAPGLLPGRDLLWRDQDLRTERE